MSWLQPLCALLEQPVSRTMLLVALILASTNLLEKWLVIRLDIFTLSWVYALGSSIIFGLVLVCRRPLPIAEPLGRRWTILLAAASADASTLIFQFASLQYLSAVVTLSFKRSGILLTILAGRVFFREQNVGPHLIAATIMIGGAIMLYLPFKPLQQAAFSVFLFLLGVIGPRLLVHRQDIQSPMR
jgi:drug/metabolite transporter (DMT)-like permease